jgi:hypothetical protein
MSKELATRHCESGIYCCVCRDQEVGRAWRASLTNMGAPDFECPQGKEWDWRPPSRGIGDTVEKVIHAVTLGLVRPCGGCKKRRDRLNRLWPYRTQNAEG